MDRFSARRMADGYEALYARMLHLDEGGERGSGHRLVEMPARRRTPVATVQPDGDDETATGIAVESAPDPTEATPA
jgi:hypothetical protein